MRILFLALWLQMSAQLPYNSVDCDNANGNPKLCTVELDENEWPSDKPCPACPLWKEFSQAAQRAADETDGKRDGRRDIPYTKLQSAEPVDVPAVQEFGGHMPNVDDRRKCVADSEPAESGVACLSDQVWTCKDKTRVLQFSENGEKHCIKF